MGSIAQESSNKEINIVVINLIIKFSQDACLMLL